MRKQNTRKAAPASNGAAPYLNNDGGCPRLPRGQQEIRVTIDYTSPAGLNVLSFQIPVTPTRRIRAYVEGNRVTIADVIAGAIRFYLYPEGGGVNQLDTYLLEEDGDAEYAEVFSEEEVLSEWTIPALDGKGAK